MQSKSTPTINSTMTTPSSNKSATSSEMLTPAKISASFPRAETPKSRDTKGAKRIRRRTQNQPASTTPVRVQGKNNRKSHSMSPPILGCYASSKWSDSPSARSIPLPPESWLELTSAGSSIGSTSSSDSESSSTAPHSTSPSYEKKSESPEVFQQVTPKTCRVEQNIKATQVSGRRMCPLELISEVMALSVAN